MKKRILDEGFQAFTDLLGLLPPNLLACLRAFCCWLLAARAIHCSAHDVYPVQPQTQTTSCVSKACVAPCTCSAQQQPEEVHPVGDDIRSFGLPRVVRRGGWSTIYEGGAAVHAVLTATAIACAADGQASDCRRPRLTSEGDHDRAGTRKWKRISRCHSRRNSTVSLVFGVVKGERITF